MSKVQEQLKSAELQLATSRTTLSDEKTILETEIERHKKQLTLVQAEFDAEKVNTTMTFKSRYHCTCLYVCT